MSKSSASTKLSATEARNLRTLLLLSVFDQEEKEAVGRRIASARARAGLRQEDLARLAGVSTRALQGHERGEHHFNPWKHLHSYAEHTAVTEDWLLHGDRDEATSIAEIRAELAAVRRLLEELLEQREPPAERQA